MRFLTTFQLADFLDTLVSLTTAFVLGTLNWRGAAISATHGRPAHQRIGGGRRGGLRRSRVHLTGTDGAVRVIAYVVSGIGFLGAGVIMKQGMDVRGLNTAATLWHRRRSGPAPAPTWSRRLRR